ncbi:hypothetical protein PINS_up005775 [Pythium insidiosum]|nr:hypothetical protein PINS_up005775 [Pythium insidiosum]
MAEAMSHSSPVSACDVHDDVTKLLKRARDDTESDLLGDTNLSKDEERKHKNREAAARSRRRARDRMAQLEQLVSHLMQRNYELQLEAERLKMQLLSSYTHVPLASAATAANPPATYHYSF